MGGMGDKWLDRLARRAAGGPHKPRETGPPNKPGEVHDAVSRRHLISRAGIVGAAAASYVLPGWNSALAACRKGLTKCSGRCVNLKSSENHCGRCGNKCKSNQYCSKGKCCKNGLTNCGGMCVDRKTHENHCGQCGNRCASNEICVNGTCEKDNPCAAGQTLCNGVCVDTDSNPDHCGACNNSCDNGVACATHTCSNGTCLHTPNDSVCTDTNLCNGHETCNPMVGCVAGTPTNPDDGNACTTDACDPQTGQVSNTAINCDDSNPCTDDTCDPQTGCVHTNVANGTPCPQGVCTNGVCGPECQTAGDCNDNNPCTNSTCQNNVCVHTAVANQTNCPGGTCNNGVCDTCPNAGNPCQVGIGPCARVGKIVCQNGQGQCNVVPGPPSTEVCNGIDDDCDGQIDEGNPGGGASCNTGQAGRCAAGTLTCINGSLICKRNNEPAPETCNGLDDDCDGQVDEGNPGGGATCNTGMAGVCAQGTMTCMNGSLGCKPNNQPTQEVCNGLDDDCDGMVDEGNPGGGAQCTTPGGGPGFTQCVNGALTCVPSIN